MLGVPGEELENVFSARAFVNWYNGHPEFVHLSPNLDVEHVVVIGNGNVAIDCARILVKSVEELAATDIADHALKALRERYTLLPFLFPSCVVTEVLECAC